ncbi:MAG: coproporphyrinogen III oxidase family protein, partial [Desulfomonilaceae bacterium]|nr:coproporphyrinogen III oxidase family protein [Desulfomonilaceae bacterium]
TWSAKPRSVCLMIVESVLTAYLKHKYSTLLQFESLEAVEPPRPRPGVEYLLYVHIPFCEELCPYCSFNRFPFEKSLAQEYFGGLGREIAMYADLGYDFRSVYVGGGTPTVLPDEMARLLDDLRSRFGVREISLETNPNHLTDDIIGTLKDGGVNRLSVGVQSFNDSLLKQMERYHKYGSGTEIRDRLAGLMGVFDTLNVDMIFNFPTQTEEMLAKDVEIIKEIKADQVTFYPLMVSDVTRKELARRFGPVSYRQEKRFYTRIVEGLEAEYGFGTAWCFSRKKTMIDEYIVDYDEYVGVGSGSFGYANGICFANTFSVPDYLDRIRRGAFPLLAKKEFSRTEQIHYDFMMKLFGSSLDVERAEGKFHGEFMKTLWKEIHLFKLLSALVNENGRIRLTRRGRYLWVIMLREFFTGVNNFRDMCRSTIQGR